MTGRWEWDGELQRTEVPGGWLYLVPDAGVAFVPRPHESMRWPVRELKPRALTGKELAELEAEFRWRYSPAPALWGVPRRIAAWLRRRRP